MGDSTVLPSTPPLLTTEYKTTVFDPLPIKILRKILSSLSLEGKKKCRRVCKEWNKMVSGTIKFKIPPISDVSVHTIANSSLEIHELIVTSLILSLPMIVNFKNGHKVKKIKFRAPDVSEDNMIWLLTKCYSVKELSFEQGESGGKFIDFITSKAFKIINMSSRTLKSISIIGEKINRREHNGKEVEEKYRKKILDCSILKDCNSLQSFLIINLPFIMLKNIQLLPSTLAHLALEKSSGEISSIFNQKGDKFESDAVENNSKICNKIENGISDKCESAVQNNAQKICNNIDDKCGSDVSMNGEKISNSKHGDSSSTSIDGKVGNKCHSLNNDEKNCKLVSLGFIDFSAPPLSPIIQTFTIVIRTTRLKRVFAKGDLNGQKLLEACENIRSFKASWNSELNHYQLFPSINCENGDGINSVMDKYNRQSNKESNLITEL